MKKKKKGEDRNTNLMSKDDIKIIGYKYGTIFETIWAMDKQTEDRLYLVSSVSNFIKT